LEVLDRLETAGVETVLDGGWGLDALVSEETRPHADLDLAVRREALQQVEASLAEIGFEQDESAEPGLPARLVLRDRAGRQVDLHPLVFDEHGNGWQELGDGTWGLYSAEGLRGTGSVGGRTVRCLTPELQHRFLLRSSWDEDDHRDLRLLAEHFGLPLPPS
jgi:lincosamide nucleotidyltransferase A/C/D/E